LHDQALRYVQERAVVGLLRVAVRVFTTADAPTAGGAEGSAPPIAAVVSVLTALAQLPPAVASDNAARVAAGLALLLRLGPTPAALAGGGGGDGGGGDMAHVLAYYDAYFGAVDAAKAYFYGGMGVWDVLCYCVSQAPAARLAAMLPAHAPALHRHLFAHVLHTLSTYLHMRAGESAVAGLAAAVLLADADAGGGGGGTAGHLESLAGGGGGGGHSTPPRRGGAHGADAAVADSPGSAAARRARGRGGLGRYRGRAGSGGAAAVTSITSEHAAVARHTRGDYRAAMQAHVGDEPMADLREFAAAAVLRLVEQLAHAVAPPAPLDAAVGGSGEWVAAVDTCWLMLLNLLRAALLHLTVAGTPAPAAPATAEDDAWAALALPPPPPHLAQAVAAFDARSVNRIRPHVLRAAAAVLQRVLVAPPPLATPPPGADAPAPPPPLANESWHTAWLDCILPVLAHTARHAYGVYPVDVPAVHTAALSLEVAAQLIAATNLAARSFLDHWPSRAVPGDSAFFGPGGGGRAAGQMPPPPPPPPPAPAAVQSEAAARATAAEAGDARATVAAAAMACMRNALDIIGAAAADTSQPHASVVLQVQHMSLAVLQAHCPAVLSEWRDAAVAAAAPAAGGDARGAAGAAAAARAIADAEAARLAAAADAEAARLVAAADAEAARLAAAAEAEAARLAADAEVARVAAIAGAEAARLAAAAEVEAVRLAAEAEAARLAVAAKAEEEARVAAAAKAEEEARVAAEVEAARVAAAMEAEARVAAAAKAEEEARVAAAADRDAGNAAASNVANGGASGGAGASPAAAKPATPVVCKPKSRGLFATLFHVMVGVDDEEGEAAGSAAGASVSPARKT